MAESLTDVANLALDLLGASTVTNIDADTAPAPTLKRLLETTIKEVAAKYHWQELQTKATLTPVSTDSNTGYSKVVLPVNCIRVLEVYAGETKYNDYAVKWYMEGGYLYAATASPTILYIAYNETPNTWTPLFLKAVYYELAIKASMRITQNARIRADLVKQYEMMVLPELRRLASKARQSSPTRKSRFNWRAARYGN